MAKTHYDELKLEWSASTADIKRSYRKLAREHHPDAQSGSDAAFVRLQTAYDVLSDPEKRQVYDDELAAAKTAALAAPTPTPKVSNTTPFKPKTPGKRRWTPFRVTVLILLALIVVLFVRVARTWSGGVGTLPSPTLPPPVTDSPSPSPTPTPSPLPTPPPPQRRQRSVDPCWLRL